MFGLEEKTFLKQVTIWLVAFGNGQPVYFGSCYQDRDIIIQLLLPPRTRDNLFLLPEIAGNLLITSVTRNETGEYMYCFCYLNQETICFSFLFPKTKKLVFISTL